VVIIKFKWPFNFCMKISHQWCCSACLGFEFLSFGINGCVVHGRGFEYLTFWGVNGGVVHGRGFESLTLWESMLV
jgi:hypothetical protein